VEQIASFWGKHFASLLHFISYQITNQERDIAFLHALGSISPKSQPAPPSILVDKQQQQVATSITVGEGFCMEM